MSLLQTTGIEFPHDNDVLSGRGNFVNGHPGNKQFRDYVHKQRDHYTATPKGDKPLFAKLIVNTIRNLIPPGRFLIQDKNSKLWSDIGDRKAWDKTRQALREKALGITDTIESIIVPPADDSLLMTLGMESSTIASSSAMKLRSILVRQMSVAASLGGSDPWLPDNVAPSNDGKTRSDKNIHLPGGPQASSDPSTTLCGTEDTSRLNLNDEEHHKTPAAADDIEGVNNSGDGSEDRATFIHDPSGKSIPLRSSFTQKPDRSNLKRSPKYSESSLGTMSSTGLSLRDSGVTGITNLTNLSSVAGISFATASCSSDFVPKTNMGNDTDPNAFNNSLFFEGQMSETAPTLDTASNLSRTSLASSIRMGHDGTNVSNNSLYIDGQMSEIPPKLIRTIQGKQISGLTSATSISTLRHSLLHEKQMSGLTSAPSISSLKKSLLRTSFSAFVPGDDIGEGDEDDPYEVDEDLKNESLPSMNTNEIMSARVRRHSSILSRKNSMHSSLDDLSYMSGRMSICEHMSITDSGIFSMTDADMVDFHKELNDWEENAQIEDARSAQAEIQLHDANCEEVYNMTQMSSMMSDIV
eukprot:CAMPEP_0198255644 /NCGR_PEP_ID=MMETSP1447-20131203/5718_1 /TAXON_ID=420782 /ORGANISM="Chaetoceros dichaeta, Strain CCMP1751" /LENGTH=580 /DNA_ID=CAMNT_0043942057 /DNA_START=118 /DNA_END=1860 /DNA_ORIENTATION=-